MLRAAQTLLTGENWHGPISFSRRSDVFPAPGAAPALPRTQRPDRGDCSTHTSHMSSNWADDSGDLPPPMSGGGGGSSAPAAAPSGYVSRGSLSPSADASAPDAPLTTLLDPFTRAEASPRTCPRTHAIAPRANATGAASAETTGEAVRHPTPALRTFSARRARRVCRHRAPRKRSAAGAIFHFSGCERDGIARDRPRRRRHLRTRPAAAMRHTARGLSRALECRCRSRHRRAWVRANPKRARKRACGIGTSLCVSWLPEGRSVSVGRLFF